MALAFKVRARGLSRAAPSATLGVGGKCAESKIRTTSLTVSSGGWTVIGAQKVPGMPIVSAGRKCAVTSRNEGSPFDRPRHLAVPGEDLVHVGLVQLKRESRACQVVPRDNRFE